MENLSFDKYKYIFTSIPSMLLVGDSAESNRNKQMALFLNELNTYNILLKDLINFPIKENDRNIVLNISYYIMNNDDLLEITIKRKKLPILKLSKLTKIKPDYLEKYRDYIIAYYIILTNPNYKSIQDYFRIKLKEDNDRVNISNKKQYLYKGLVIKSAKKSAYIITSKGEFFKIKTNTKASIGQIGEGKEKKLLINYRIHISILLVILILIGCGTVIEYRRIQSIVVIESTSNIKLHVNKFNRVIYVYSPTDKGKELVANINVLNKDIDEAVAEIFQYALNNKMLDLNKKVLVTINGQAIKYGLLTKTNKIVSENNIPIVINNAGNEQRLPEYLTQDEEAKTEK